MIKLGVVLMKKEENIRVLNIGMMGKDLTKMMKNNMEKKDILICDCNSTEHQMVIYYSEDDNENMCYVHIHLNKRPFLWRLVYGIKYIFGRKCNYGAFDEFIFNSDDTEKLQDLVNYLKKEK